MDDSQIITAIVLIAIGIILFFAEVLLPTGGILGFAAAVALIAGIVMLFYKDTTLGLLGVIAALILVPIALGFGMKIWPHTPVGRMLILNAPTTSDATSRVAARELVGKRGKTITDLHPVGTCLIDGKRLDCLSSTGTIPRDTTVEVITATGFEIKVRQVDEV